MKIQKNQNKFMSMILIFGITLLILVAGTATSISLYNYKYTYAVVANNSEPSPSKPLPPIGSKTFLTVTTKVSGGKFNPSDFTVTVSGNNPSPKSFPGSSTGTSVTLNSGKYKVTASGPTGYTTTYSSRCSGTASGGVPIKCTILSTFSSPSPSPSGSKSPSTKMTATLTVTGKVRANCDITSCPQDSDMTAEIYTDPTFDLLGTFHPGQVGKVSIPIGQQYRIIGVCSGVAIPTSTCVWPHPGGVPIPVFGYEQSFIAGDCSGTGLCIATMGPKGASAEVNYYWKCLLPICASPPSQSKH